MSRELPPQYNPKEVEDKIYRMWEESGFFNPDKLPSKKGKPFTIIMPPPNANGALHIGHAVFVTLQDIITRFQRMRGRKTLWLPGADHAGFETQVVFDKKLEKEGRRRSEIPREKLHQEMLDFTLENKKVMEGQLRKLGASCDWSREKFTLDPDIVKIVTDTFVKLYKDGLLYRGERIVNWCVKHQTTLSDLEVRYEERENPLYYIKYGPFEIATARPETKFGDKYVVMHPRDKRYAKYKDGEKLEVEWINGPITATIIKDGVIDMNFGTGAMTITPWHDPIDFELSTRRQLDKEPIIDRYGKLLPIAGEFAGMKIAEARPEIVEKLKSKGLLVKIDPNYKHNVAVCYKCGNVVEPMIMPQWFVKMQPLAEKAIRAVERGEIKIIPGRYKKVYFHWLKNIRDWNISRQIVWGIRIPAWYKGGDIYVGNTAPKGGGWTHDPDVLDTWFSSGQWPFAALRYPKDKDFKTFYPTDVMETGYDILFFWVARMVMLGIYSTGQAPFRTVYLHGLVRDKDRQKMSKSKGNVIDPLGVAEAYGTDAVRMALTIGNLPGNDIIISEEKIRGYRNFANKVWNASRFLLLHVFTHHDPKKVEFGTKEKAMRLKLQKVVREVTRDLEAYKFHHAADKLYHFFWHYYADKVIEEMKPKLDPAAGTVERETAKALLLEFHATLLKLLHPFMPFITEEIWSQLPIKNKKLLIVEEWPK